MDSKHTHTYHAYYRIREQIITLKLAPGSLIHEEQLAETLGIDLVYVQEAITLLAHDDLVKDDPQYGLYVSNVDLADMTQLSDMRLNLEPLSAWLAAQHATADDIVVLESLRRQYEQASGEDQKHLFLLDHQFHQAVARAAHNKYLSATLEHYFGLAQRLWYLSIPKKILSLAVEQHLHLLEAIKAGKAGLAQSIMREHVEGFYTRALHTLTGRVTAHYGSEARSVIVENRALLGGAIIATGLPFEEPCGGQGICGQCKVLVEGEMFPPDDVEQKQLSAAERVLGYRLACRARVKGDVSVRLAPVQVYSNKIFQICNIDAEGDCPLGLAIDLGSTTVAAFLVRLTDGNVCAGAASLNHQTSFGADVISRLAGANLGGEFAERLSALAQVSIAQAIDALSLPRQARTRIQKVVIVGNCAMHHLLLRYPVSTLTELPFQPGSTRMVRGSLFHGTLPAQAEVVMPPLIGGFVGSDALACLLYFAFDRASAPMAAIDLGTNGEVMVTDGNRIVTASTAAGPAFEGVNISCGIRAVDGGIVAVQAHAEEGSFTFTTIGDAPPVGLTGSGLLNVVYALRQIGIIEPTGRLVTDHPTFGDRIERGENGGRRLRLTDQTEDSPALYLTQRDIRELQKAKAAIRATTDILIKQLESQASDLHRIILTGSFGSQLNIEAVTGIGMIPPVDFARIEHQANGAGFGAAVMLREDELARAEHIAENAEQVELDLDPEFNSRYVDAMKMTLE